MEAILDQTKNSVSLSLAIKVHLVWCSVSWFTHHSIPRLPWMSWGWKACPLLLLPPSHCQSSVHHSHPEIVFSELSVCGLQEFPFQDWSSFGTEVWYPLQSRDCHVVQTSSLNFCTKFWQQEERVADKTKHSAQLLLLMAVQGLSKHDAWTCSPFISNQPNASGKLTNRLIKAMLLTFLLPLFGLEWHILHTNLEFPLTVVSTSSDG